MVRTLRCVALAGVAAACGEQGTDVASSSQIAVAFETKRIGKRLWVTLTTEPGIALSMATCNNDVEWNCGMQFGGPIAWVDVAGPAATGGGGHEARADDRGKAVFELSDVFGNHWLEVTATESRAGNSAGRVTRHKLRFTVDPPKQIDISIDDATPDPGGAPRLEPCYGAFEGGEDFEPVPICTTSLQLGKDFTVGLAIKAESGKSITIGERAFDFKDGAVEARIDLKPAMATLVLSALSSRDRLLEFPVNLELASGTRKGTISLGRTGVNEFLLRVVKGPVLFPNEPPAVGTQASALVISEVGGEWKYFGNDVPLASLDLIAIIDSRLRRGRSCSYKATDGSHERKTVKPAARDLISTIYDRRTGKQLARRAYPAKMPGCDEWITADDTGGYAQVDEQEVVDWIETFVAK